MISAVVLTKNEEGNIEECLKTLAWCDEIIIVDDYSEDRTIAKISNFQFPISNKKNKQRDGIFLKRGIKIFKRHLNNDFAAQRNFGLEKAKGRWVLFVDADERIIPELEREIRKTILTQKSAVAKNCDGYFIRRKDFLFGNWLKHGETANIKLLRLAKKGAGEWVRSVHEVWEIKGKVGELVSPLLHYPHQTIQEFLEDINFYTDLNAKVFFSQGIKTSWRQIVAYPVAKFIRNYFLKCGFLDGVPGLLHAIFMSFHSFLTRAKLWHLWQKNEVF